MIEKPYLDVRSLATLKIDMSYQRELQPKWVDRLEREWDDRKSEALCVSDRGDDGLFVIDGQHRRAALMQLAEEDALCWVYEKLTPAEEAELYVTWNKERKAVSPYALHRANVVRGDEIANIVETTLNDYQYKVTDATGPGRVTAVSACRRIVFENGEDVFRAVIGTVRRAWGDDRQGTRGSILLGLAAFVNRHPDVRQQDLVAKLSTVPPSEIIRRASAIHAGTGGQTFSFYSAIVEKYNTGRRPQNRLEVTKQQGAPLRWCPTCHNRTPKALARTGSHGSWNCELCRNGKPL